MRVLLLGGTGFIGTAANRALRAAGHATVTLARSSYADVRLDADDWPALAEHIGTEHYDAIVNLLGAGLSAGSADEETMQRINSEAPARLLETVRGLARRPRIVHAASSTERRPDQQVDESVYSSSKHAGALLLRQGAADTGVPLTILTVHNAYGRAQPARRFVAHVIGELSAGRPVVLNYPDRVRDFVLVDEVGACFARALEQRTDGLVEAEAGTGVGITLMEAAGTIAAELGRPADLVSVDPSHRTDPNPVTVSPIHGGSYGLCTTGFREGIQRILREH